MKSRRLLLLLLILLAVLIVAVAAFLAFDTDPAAAPGDEPTFQRLPQGATHGILLAGGEAQTMEWAIERARAALAA